MREQLFFTHKYKDTREQLFITHKYKDTREQSFNLTVTKKNAPPKILTEHCENGRKIICRFAYKRL